MSDNPSIDEIAKAVGEAVDDTPRPARDLVEDINRALGTDYDARGIGRGISRAVDNGTVAKTGASSRPLYSKGTASS